MRKYLPKIIGVTGIVFATALAMYPRWDRRWRDNVAMESEATDVVRAFLLTGPPLPPVRFNRYAAVPYSYSADVRWGEALGMWCLVAFPFMFVASMLNSLPPRGVDGWEPDDPRERPQPRRGDPRA